MDNAPEVTVLMCVYNGEKYLGEAIESILHQSFTDFEFLIIDDASTDSSSHIIQQYQDRRIRLVANDANLGLTKSLNRGLQLARGRYIARMDADDISLPARLEKQVSFMQEHPQVGICGTWFQIIGEKPKMVRHPAGHQEIITLMFRHSAIGHPTAFFRKQLFDKEHLRYNETFLSAQDYELWVKASMVTRLANIPEVLLQYRRHTQQVSKVKLKEQKRFAFQAKIPLFASLLGTEAKQLAAIDTYRKLLTSGEAFSAAESAALVKLLHALRQANQNKQMFEPLMFDKILSEHYQKLAGRATNSCNLSAFRLLRSSPFYAGLAYKQRIKLFYRSVYNTLVHNA